MTRGVPVLIERRFNGPPDSANGGYTCGLVAAAYGANEVTLASRRPSTPRSTYARTASTTATRSWRRPPTPT